MESINWVRAHDNTGGHSAIRPTRRPPRTDKVRVLNRRIVVGDVDPIPITFASLVNGGACSKSRDVRRATIRRMVSDGKNGLCLRNFIGKYHWDRGGSSYGGWRYDTTSGAPWAITANRWALEERGVVYGTDATTDTTGEPTGLRALDEMIADALDLGMEAIYIDSEDIWSIISRHSSQRPVGTFEGRSMQYLFPEARAMVREQMARFFARTSTVPGFGRYCDHPRIMWKFRNEMSASDAYRDDYDSWGGSTFVGSSTNTSNVILVADTSQLRIGFRVTGTPIGSGTVLITAIVPNTSITVSVACDATQTDFVFGVEHQWHDKIVEGITDSFGNNDYWASTLNAALVAWRDANYPSWTIPAWGRGAHAGSGATGAVGFPRYSVWNAWGDDNDKKHIVWFLADLDYAEVLDEQAWCRAYRADVLLNTCTGHYTDIRCHIALPDEYALYSFIEDHTYKYGYDGIGPKKGTSRSGGSMVNYVSGSTHWPGSYTRDGIWERVAALGNDPRIGRIASECGQYDPSPFGYERMPLEAIHAACLGYSIAEFADGQQDTTSQLRHDGRYSNGDNQGNFPERRLANRAIAPLLRWPNVFLTEASSTYTVNINQADNRTRQAEIMSHSVAPYFMDTGGGGPNLRTNGGEHAIWTDTKIYQTMDEAVATRTDFSTYPKVLDNTLRDGYYRRNTSTEVVYVRGDQYLWQLITPYIEQYGNRIVEDPASVRHAAANREYTLRAEAMTAAVDRALMTIRSDSPYPLYTVPGKLFIHGGAYGEFVDRGSDYAIYSPGALGANDPPGAAFWMANVGVRVYYEGPAGSSVEQNWGSGGASDCMLMMPEPFTVAVFGPRLEFYRVNAGGVAERVATTYSGGATRFAYTPSLGPEYQFQPRDPPRVAPRRRVMGRR